MCSIRRNLTGRPRGTGEFETIADSKSQFNKVISSTIIQVQPYTLFPGSSVTQIVQIWLVLKKWTPL